MRAHRNLIAIPFLLAGLVLVGCTGSSELPSESAASPSGSSSPSASSSTAPVACSNATQSYAPGGSPNGGATVAAIKKRGRLIAGVSADTRLMGARNPLTGKIEGFDISVLQQVSQAIFGSPDKIEYKVITTADRTPALQDGDVDIVARAFTMTCARWNDIAFSAVYYEAGQKVLVRSDSSAKTLADLKGQKVCAPTGSTTISTLNSDYPDVEAVGAATHTDCLVLFQNGSVDAITGDDTILAGLASQDPYARVVGPKITKEPYGLGIEKGDVAFVQFVNRVLENMRADGTWQAAYAKWLAGPLASSGGAAQPNPVYGRS